MHIFVKALGVTLTVAMISACSDLSSKDGVAYNNEVVDPDKITCRTVVKTGTRIGSKVCKTNRTWAEIARASQAGLDDTTRRAAQTQTYNEGGR
jgi:hypothetical protein